jgi:hypothetical protein
MSWVPGPSSISGFEHLGVLFGALSRTRKSRFEVMEGFELRLWVLPETVMVEQAALSPLRI